MTTLYVHGFASSGKSSTASKLREILGVDELVFAPTLSHSPAADFELLCAYVRTQKITTVVGSSLGGFYALGLGQKFDLRVILLNPSLRPYETLARHLGTMTVYGTDLTFPWTQKHLDELRTIGGIVDRALDPERSSLTWRNVLVLLGAKDETLDSALTASMFPRARVVTAETEGHRFENVFAYADRIRAVATSASDTEEDHPVWSDA